MRDLTNEVRDVMVAAGCDLCGIAEVGRFGNAPRGCRPSDVLPTAQSVIVGAVHILDSVCDDLPDTRYEYTNQFYVLNGVLNLAATKAARFLEERGYRAIPIPAAYPRVNKELMGVFSHRHAAVLAGLGEIGLSNLLITPQFGPRVRLVSVVTEALLEPNQPYQQELCARHRNECKLACVERCPVEALTADGRINKERCLRYQEQIMPWSAVELRCGICVGACPIGKRTFRITPVPRDEDVREMKARWTGAKW